MAKVVVIIVTYNPKKWIEKCFSVLKTSTIPVSIIAIDNGSNDGSQKIIKENYPEVDFLQFEENLGFGRANNIGIKKAYDEGADYVYLLNQDAWIEPNTIKNLIDVANRNPSYGIVSSLHLNGNGTGLDLKFSNYLGTTDCPNFVSDLSLKKQLAEIYPCSFINAAAWLLPRKTIETCGGFDPLFFHYGEDDNYCQRVLFHGLKIGVVPSERIYHDRPQTLNQENPFENTNKYQKYINIMIANVNNENFERAYSKQLSKLKRELYASLFTLNILNFKRWYSLYKHLKNSKSRLFLSYESNKSKKLLYLE